MKHYVKMKDSCVEWIGNIPNHWENIRCFSLIKQKHIKNTKDEENLSVYRDFGVILRNSRNDNFNRISEDIGNYKLVEKGDLVLNKMKCFTGSLGISEYRGIVSPAYKVYEITQNFNGKFLHYLLRSKKYVQEFERLSTGIRPNQWELKHKDFKNIPILKPHSEEQDDIVTFLDKKISKIDSNIQKYQKFVTLLQEKKQVTINHAVTKGLDDSVPMKDSGIEWIGEIPEGWKLTKLIWDFKNIGSGTTPKKERNYYVNGTVSWVNSGDLNDSFIDSTKNLLNQSVLDDYSILKLFPKNTVIIAMYGATIGKLGILKEEAITNQACCNLSNSTKIDFKFLFYWFLAFRKIIISFAEGGGQPNINMELIKSLRLFYPSKKEQKQLVDFLDKQTMHMDKLISKAKLQIKTLQEYRQSLISSAVTGKIDVREAIA